MARACGFFVATISVLLVIVAATNLNGESGSRGLVWGSVIDARGASVPAATVEITNLATGVTQKQGVNAAGQYVFPNIVPGDYVLKVTAPGFRTASVADLRVEVTKSYLQDVRLQVWQVTETVEATAEDNAE